MDSFAHGDGLIYVGMDTSKEKIAVAVLSPGVEKPAEPFHIRRVDHHRRAVVGGPAVVAVAGAGCRRPGRGGWG
jgi:hypothetical protein